MTGGHLDTRADSVTDYLFTAVVPSMAADCLETSHPRIASRNTHGTGCTFSAAFGAFHLLTGDDREAFRRASAYLAGLIEKSAAGRMGHGTGPLMHHIR